jgi:hypothetical protein
MTGDGHEGPNREGGRAGRGAALEVCRLPSQVWPLLKHLLVHDPGARAGEVNAVSSDRLHLIVRLNRVYKGVVSLDSLNWASACTFHAHESLTVRTIQLRSVAGPWATDGVVTK